jgi:septum site-determining protein MinC
MAFAITPKPPIMEWLAELDSGLLGSQAFFAGHPVALDLSTANLSAHAIGELIASLEERQIRIIGIEGVDPAKWQPGLPPVLRGGRSARGVELPGAEGLASHAPPPPPPAPKAEAAPVAVPALPPKQEPASLLIEDPVRSGQSVIFTEGDVTVLGSVGSGAEIVAGGSIHVYGTLRGRALAGATGNARARIFCHRIEAELLAIDSFYRTADEIDESLRRRPAQAWLEGGTLQVSAMN